MHITRCATFESCRGSIEKAVCGLWLVFVNVVVPASLLPMVDRTNVVHEDS